MTERIIDLNALREQRRTCKHTFEQSEWTCDHCGIDIEDVK